MYFLCFSDYLEKDLQIDGNGLKRVKKRNRLFDILAVRGPIPDLKYRI